VRPLSEQIPPKGLPVDRLIAFGCAFAARLSSDHALDVARGDLHPDRILWDGDRTVELAETPVPARVPDPLPDVEGPAALAAVGYLAPEQLLGQPITVRTDMFVVGIILWQVATGAHPFADQRCHEIVSNIESFHPPQPGRTRDHLPIEWDQMCMISLHKEPPMRLASALDLETLMKQLAAHPTRGTRRDRQPRKLRLGRLLFAVLAAAAITLLLAWIL
jgi:serine/threonine protein kinase